MPHIRIRVHGELGVTKTFLKKALQSAQETQIFHVLEKYGQKGVQELMAATPRDSGLTANSWSYHIEGTDTRHVIVWTNSNVHTSEHAKAPVNVALILQTGHGKKNGGYVKGIDYINPALKPVFEGMAAELSSFMNK